MRRRFTRGGARPLRRMLMRGIPLLLIRSNELLTSGQFARTADGLEELARAAEGRQGRHAGDLYLRTGRARIMAGQSAEGLELLKRGVGLLSASPFHHRRARSARRIINELRDRGREQEAGGIAALLDSLAPDSKSLAEAPAALRRPPLPTRCPACGAPVRPDEVQWLDDITVERAYYGSPVRSEQAALGPNIRLGGRRHSAAGNRC